MTADEELREIEASVLAAVANVQRHIAYTTANMDRVRDDLTTLVLQSKDARKVASRASMIRRDIEHSALWLRLATSNMARLEERVQPKEATHELF